MAEEEFGDERTRSVSLLAEGTIVARYRIVEAMASGGMGEVYVAEDSELGRKVALKLMPRHLRGDERAVVRFRREAKAVAALGHPNIVTIHEVAEYEERPFIAMELVEGRTLAAVIRGGELTLPQVLDISIQIGEGLQAAHESGIVHRDVKPANILIDLEQRVRLVDFGLARIESENSITKTGSTLGTVGYMSPEQVKGETVDRRSDVFSFGVVLYEVLTGRHPFRRESQAATMSAIVNDEPDSMARYVLRIPESLTRIVEKMLRKEREARYQTMADLVADVRTVRGEIGSGAVQTFRRKQAREPRRRRILAWGVVGAVLLLGAVLAAIPSSRDFLAAFFGSNQSSAAKHLVILPFENIGGGSENQVFCDGLIETITAKLTGLEQSADDFWVVPASNVRSRGVVSVDQSRRVFNANLALTGSVQRLEERVRLTFNLADAQTGRQLRSSVIDADVSDLYGLQDSTVAEVAKMLEIELQAEEQRLLKAGGTTEAEAYDLYLKGQGYLQNQERVGYVDSAIALFERALEKDPRYSLALAGLGEAYWLRYVDTRDPQWVEPALEKCHQAIALEAQIAPVYVTLGRVFYGTGRYEEAVAEFQQALELDPVNYEALRRLARTFEALNEIEQAEATYRKLIDLRPYCVNGYQRLALFHTRQGQFEKAIGQLQRVVELIPEDVKAYNDLGMMYFRVERAEEAIDMWRHSLSIEPNYAAYSNLGAIMFQNEDYEGAAAMYDSALTLDGGNYKVWGNLAAACKRVGGRDEQARSAFRRALQIAEKRREVNPRDLDVLLYLAEYYSEVDERDSALSLAVKVLDSAPDNVAAILHIAGIYEHLGERDRALELIEAAVRLGCAASTIANYDAFRSLRADARLRRLLETGPDDKHRDSAGLE